MSKSFLNEEHQMYNPLAVFPCSITMQNRIGFEGTKVMFNGRPGVETASISAITEMDSDFRPARGRSLVARSRIRRKRLLTYT